MLKKERLIKILEKVNEKGIININEIVAELNVSDMTVRRDLDELEKNGQLKRIHGGAQSIEVPVVTERSNSEKQGLQTAEKEEIAQIAMETVYVGDTIFIGPGTTLELFAQQLKSHQIRVITNSLPIFDILKDSETVDLILLGGEYRPITGAFVGNITKKSLEDLSFSKTYVSANGINGQTIATYSEGEGIIQQLALDKAMTKILLADSSKFGKFDFYNFYNLNNLDTVITDSNLSQEFYEQYSKFVTFKTANTTLKND